MRHRRIIAVALGATLVLAGTAVPASAASPYDPGTATSMRNLAVAMQSYAMFDGNDLYTEVTEDALADWGWTPGSSMAVQIVIEGDGESWWAVGQDTHAGSREYTFTSSTKVNGVNPGAVGVSNPQPPVAATTPGVEIRDVGQQVDIGELAAQLVAGGVTVQQVCDATVTLPGTHTAGSSLSDQTLACEAAVASGASMSSVLAAILKAGGEAVVTYIALEFIGDGSSPASTPPWVGTPEGPTTPRPVPATIPDSVWKVTRVAERFAAANQVDDQTARTVVRQCLAYVANAMNGLDPYEECSSTPIFASGRSDVPEATQHDTEALAQNPAWVQLNYRPAAENPSYDQWYRYDPVCVAKLPGQNCDEYPFYSTQQGGHLAVPRPSLKAIDGPQNQLQGTKFNTFRAACGLQSGDAFLAVPIPESAPTVPTVAVCNAG